MALRPIAMVGRHKPEQTAWGALSFATRRAIASGVGTPLRRCSAGSEAFEVRVVQGGECLGFALEAGDPVGIASEQRGQDLDRDITIQLRVPR